MCNKIKITNLYYGRRFYITFLVVFLCLPTMLETDTHETEYRIEPAPESAASMASSRCTFNRKMFFLCIIKKDCWIKTENPMIDIDLNISDRKRYACEVENLFKNEKPECTDVYGVREDIKTVKGCCIAETTSGLIFLIAVAMIILYLNKNRL